MFFAESPQAPAPWHLRLAGAGAAGLVLGTRVPVLLTSRSDSMEARVNSCAVAALHAHAIGR